MIEPRLATTVFLCALASGCVGAEPQLLARASSVDAGERHPIVLRQEMTSLEVIAARHLDLRARARIAEFAGVYRIAGAGPIYADVPVRPAHDGRRLFDEIRRELLANGISASMKVRPYPVNDPEAVGTIRLSFAAVKAQVSSNCGEWTDDIGAGQGGWRNEPYGNFGCAYQSMIAAQTADPRDLISKQADAPPDAAARVRALDKTRAAADASTDWKAKLQ